MKGDDDYAGIFKEQHRQNHDWNDGRSSCWNNGMVMECYHGKGVLTGSFLFRDIYIRLYDKGGVSMYEYYWIELLLGVTFIGMVVKDYIVERRNRDAN